MEDEPTTTFTVTVYYANTNRGCTTVSDVLDWEVREGIFVLDQGAGKQSIFPAVNVASLTSVPNKA